MINKTLCYPLNLEEEKIYLGTKKVRFGKGKINGFGGGLKERETIIATAVRELEEESGFKGLEKNLIKYGEIEFYFPESKAKEWNQKVHIYLVDYKLLEGEPTGSDEISCEQYDLNYLPYDKMWDGDKYWLPQILAGKKVKGKLWFKEDCKTTERYELIEVEEF